MSFIGFQHRLLPGGSQPPETARPCHTPPTHQPSQSPAKNERRPRTRRARAKNERRPRTRRARIFFKLASRRRQTITIFYFRPAVERSITRSVGSDPLFSTFFFPFIFWVVPTVQRFEPRLPSSFFFFFFYFMGVGIFHFFSFFFL